MSILFRKISRRLAIWYYYYVRHKGDSISYLRAQGAQIGENCDLLAGISSFASTEPYLVRLGNNVTLSQGVVLVTHDGGTRVFRQDEANWKAGTGKYGIIVIGDNVFIGVNSVILPNVYIGDNVVIGAGSVVTKNVLANTVVAGNPAKPLCSLHEYRERSLEKAVTIPEEFLHRKRDYLTIHFENKEIETSSPNE